MVPTPTPTRHRMTYLLETLGDFDIELSKEVNDDKIMMEHLLTEFNLTISCIRHLKAENSSDCVHPMAGVQEFHTMDKGHGFKLGQYKDFLKCP